VNSNLNKYAHNVFSQNGEDGIIQELIHRLQISKMGFCVEFGAWDGIKFSNTFNLVKNHGWQALYIEGDSQKYELLMETARQYPNIKTRNCWIEPNQDSIHCLDNVLLEEEVLMDFDLLSIDIDSCDLEVWQSMQSYLPKIVIIEINSSIPPGIRQTHMETGDGGSFTSTLECAINKGYSLVCHTGNMIFVRNDLLPSVGLPESYYFYPESQFNWAWVPFRTKILKKFLRKLRS